MQTLRRSARTIIGIGVALFAAVESRSLNAGNIVVTDSGTPTTSTCTLAQAINAANNISLTPAGSADAGNCTGATADGNTLVLAAGATYTFEQSDNSWYGANALPAIQSSIAIEGNGATLAASHHGDPEPATSDAFRFFYVSGGLFGELPAGSLALRNLTLIGGIAKGGNGGGGGAGMGGAIFTQGHLTLDTVTLIDNSARGGNSVVGSPAGGMGQDGGSIAGGFGDAWTGIFGGAGGAGYQGAFQYPSYGGGGGGFVLANGNGNAAGPSYAGKGGGESWLGGFGWAPGGDGGGGGLGPGSSISAGTCTGSGADFGYGAADGGGGGVGGGGGDCASGKQGATGGGGGFGGGGGSGGALIGGNGGAGGFGGGGGLGSGFGVPGAGGYGGGTGGGGAGLGGGIFNHRGTLTMINTTASGNSAIGGAGSVGGSGLGAVVFNLNGSVSINFSTIAGNTVSGTNVGGPAGMAYGGGPGDGSIYSLAFGNRIEDGRSSEATLTINASIVYGTAGVNGAGNNDVVNFALNGRYTNSSSLYYGVNIGYPNPSVVGASYSPISGSVSGTPVITSDPLLGSLSPFSPSGAPRTLPIPFNSPARDGAVSCLAIVDNYAVFSTDSDERGVSRPQGGACDIGAYEYDGDYIFANGFE